LAATAYSAMDKEHPLASNQSGGRIQAVVNNQALLNGIKGGKSKKRRYSRKMKGGQLGLPGERKNSIYNGGASKKRRSHRRRHSKKRRSHKRHYSRKMKGGRRPVSLSKNFMMHNGGALRPAHFKKSELKGGASKKRRSHKRRHSRKIKGGANSMLNTLQTGGGTQLMNNICHSSGYSIGPVGTELKPTEVGLAALHYAPYTKTQNN